MLLGKSNAAALVSEVQRYLKDAASELNSPFGRVDHPSLTEHHQAHRRKNPLPAINSMSRDETPEKDSARNSTTDDVEAQPILKLSTSVDNTARLATEYRTSMSTKLIHLASYFLLNLSLTLYNKALLNNFKFPWLLTGLHSSFAALGCLILQRRGYFKMSELSTAEQAKLLAFSSLFTINIAMSNVSLGMVSVPFHQIMRSTTPIFTILIHRIFFARTYESGTYLSLLPLIFGVVLTTYGDYSFTILGFICTLSGAMLAATKTVATNRLMTGTLALPPLELLLRMSPLAAIQSVVVSMLSGEFSRFVGWSNDGNLTMFFAVALLGNGLLAFLLNVSSFQTNKIAGALTMTVCGNVKQCLTVLFGIVLFNVQIHLVNGAGMLIALGGAAWYSNLELRRKTKATVGVAPAVAR